MEIKNVISPELREWRYVHVRFLEEIAYAPNLFLISKLRTPIWPHINRKVRQGTFQWEVQESMAIAKFAQFDQFVKKKPLDWITVRPRI